MVWGIRAPVWFGLTLLAVLFFIWCLLEAMELETRSAGLTWGLIIFGIIAIAAGIIAIIAQSTAGGVTRAKDALTEVKSNPLYSAGNSSDNKGGNEVPRSSPGRRLG